MNRHYQQGFTLIEIMVVVVIVAILASIAYPSYQEHVRSARRADAQAVLMQAAQFVERFHTLHATYAGAGDVLPEGLTQSPAGSTKRYYTIEVTTEASSYILMATPVTDTGQAGNGLLQYTSAGVKGWDRNNNGIIDTGETCWAKKC